MTVAGTPTQRWLPTTALDIAELLPYDHDAQPVRREYPWTDWHDGAACLNTSDEVFFGEGMARPPFSRGALRHARTICGACPVARECLTHALTQPEEYGVWAGTSGGQRARLCARLAAGETLEDVVDECLNRLPTPPRARRSSPAAATCLPSPTAPPATRRRHTVPA